MKAQALERIGQTMEVTIREATSSDQTQLEILRAQAIQATYREYLDRGTVAELVATVAADLPTWLEADRYTVILAATEITPVSFGALDDSEGEILAVFTSPDYRREGFASQVLDRIESDARDADAAHLGTIAPDPVVPFFESQGFEPSGSTEWHGISGTRLRKDW